MLAPHCQEENNPTTCGHRKGTKSSSKVRLLRKPSCRATLRYVSVQSNWTAFDRDLSQSSEKISLSTFPFRSCPYISAGFGRMPI